jgi:2',3'-cyclic-nucleotide 2'-phosphodiesterase/3'-nucleotidase
MLLAAAFLAASLAADTTTIPVLATTDMHGNLLGWDYFTAKPAARGLAKVATLIKQARAENPHTILIDNGDTIQGTPLEAVHQAGVRDGKADRPDPMVTAMNRLGYAAMAVGNHEFNFGPKNLARARDESKFPWLSANTIGGTAPFPASTIVTVAGVRVGIFGITTPNIPVWEKPEHIVGLRFEPAVEAARRAVAELRPKCDVVIGAVHAGLTPKDGAQNENMADSIARAVPGIDAMIFGHTHYDTPEMVVNGVLMTQPGRWAERLSVIRLDLAKENGSWRVVSKSARLVKVTAETPDDLEISAIAKPYHDAAEAWLNTRIATSPKALSASRGRIEDTAIIDAVNQVQLAMAKADVSFTAAFNPRARIPAGPVTVREIAALYPYENELYAVEGDGAMVKAALENSARYYLSCPDPACTKGPLTNRSMPGYNFDIAAGVSYEIDLSRPPGDRIVNLRYQGQPLDPARKLRIAINNYRYGGSNGFTMFRGAPIAWRSGQEIRDLVIDYYLGGKSLPAEPDGNWRIVPETARKVLEHETVNQ